MKSEKILAAFLLAATCAALVTVLMRARSQNMIEKPILHIAYPKSWGPLKPWLQHTMYADALLANQFEPLVDMDQNGLIVPVAASSWTVSDDFKILTFEISSSKTFSDGSKLTADDFKKSWEFGISQQPKVARKSQGDLISFLEGFDELESKGGISGLAVLPDNRLQIRFTKPFRNALSELTGSRFSAWKGSASGFIGTGPYLIVEKKSGEIEFEPNFKYIGKRGFDRAVVSILAPQEAIESIKRGSIDVFAFAGRNMQSLPCKDLEKSHVGCLSGMEGGHLTIVLNGLPGRVFQNPELRKALQSLILQGSSMQKPFTQRLVDLSQTFRIDAQSFLPLQPGRLDDSVSRELISVSDSQITAAIDLIKTNGPIRLSYAKGLPIGDWLRDYLVEAGIRLSANSGPEDFLPFLTKTMANGETDIAVFGGSVTDGDPDGLYHLLGKTGAINSPLFYRAEVGHLLEEGRQIINRALLPAHYQKVGRAIFEEVPYIHLGYSIENTLYRKDRVSIDTKTLKSRVREPLAEFMPVR